jgi:quercetin dioxygenase-like cupin family protein
MGQGAAVRRGGRPGADDPAPVRAGATYPAHDHPGGEEIFVLEGDITLGPDHLEAGDYLYTAPGNVHAVHSKSGCVVLVNVPEEVEVLRRSR